MKNMNEHFLQAGIFHLIISQTMQGKILIVKSYYIRTIDLQLKSWNITDSHIIRSRELTKQL